MIYSFNIGLHDLKWRIRLKFPVKYHNLKTPVKGM